MGQKYRVASMFAGVGGICLGFKDTGAEVVWANEFDKNACITYRKNFGDSYLVEGDIRNIDAAEITDFDILTAGFPCQAFSIAGYQKGFEDERGNLFFDIMRVLSAKKPPAFLLENVKHLEKHDKGRTFRIISEALRGEGYKIKHKVLNTMEYSNVPQNRERIFIAGFLDKKAYDYFQFPQKVKLDRTIHDIININDRKSQKYYYTESSQYYPMLESQIKRKDTVYQLRRIYVRENKSNVCPTLTANMGTGGHNVPLIKDNFGIRKLTPRECFEFQGYSSEFILPEEVSNTSLYKQAGNSVTVPLIKRLAERIIFALDKSNLSGDALDEVQLEMEPFQLSLL